MTLSRELLSPVALEKATAKLKGWEVVDRCLVKEYQCEDFRTAVAFIMVIATLAEQLDHHPDIQLHSWNRIRITLTTHSAGGLTSYDVYLAEQIERYAQRFVIVP